MRWVLLFLWGCAAETPRIDACAEVKLGACPSIPIVAGYNMVGCVAYRPAWKTVRCTFLKYDETAVLTLGTDNCGPWRLVAAGEQKR